MQRKGPDGKTIKGGDEASEDATRKVPRRSIRDRLLATEEQTDEVPPTHIATSPTADSSTSPGNDGNRPTQPGGDAPPTVYAGGPPPLPREAARHDAPPARDYVPADPPPPPRAHPSSGQTPPPTRDGPSPQRDYIPADNAATKIYRPNRPASAALTPASEPAAPASGSGAMAQAGRPKAGTPVSADHTISDPVVGWLAIVEGPGRGASLNIGYGNNRIGRAPTENVSLDFGDEQISRENHATITFDGRHRRFYVLPGQGRNLVYVNDQPVMTPQELTGGEEILLGQTKLRFVPFCGKSFDWYQK